VKPFFDVGELVRFAHFEAQAAFGFTCISHGFFYLAEFDGSDYRDLNALRVRTVKRWRLR
jgi:hypothetical protein